MDRFWSKVERRGPDECWPWLRSKNKAGYGTFKFDGRLHLAHRVAWALTHGGEVPPVLDHECHNRAAEHGECAGGLTCPHRRCCNPAHVAASTRAANSAASPLVVTTINSTRTSCVNGHPLAGENLAVRDGGRRRRCLTCARKAKNDSMARKRAREREGSSHRM